MLQPMKSRRVTPFAVLILMLIQRPASSHENVRFGRLSIEDGLSQSTVEAIVQDRSGFMWFGTEDGLNRYDGYTFTIFKHDPDDPGSISNNNIWCLHIDQNRVLWIGTYCGGLNRFDPETETFTHYLHDPSDSNSISSNRIRSILDDNQGNLWIGTRDGGLNCLKQNSQQFLRIRHDPNNENSLPSDNVRFVYPASNDSLWIATNRGFSIYDVGSDEFTHYQASPDGSNSIRNNNVRHILKDRSGIFWISTKGGLASFDRQRGQFTNYLSDPADPGSISINNIRKTYEDRQGRLWIGTTNGGLNFFDRKKNTFYSYHHDQTDPYSLSNNSVRVTFQDNSGILWIGTFGGGLNTYDPKTDHFRHYRYDPENSNSLSDPIVWAISQGPGGSIWFGTNSGGVDRYDRSTGQYVHDCYNPNNLIDIKKSNYIRSLYWDKADRLWIGSNYTGVDRYDPDTNNFINLRHDPEDSNSICHNRVRAIYQDDFGDMWFCTWGGGLDNYNQTTGTFTNFGHRPGDPNSLSDNNVISILQDSDGIYWVATSIGLNRIVFSGKSTGPASPKLSCPEITRFFHDPNDPQSISNNYVVSVHEAQNGDLWFGTMLGLSRLRKSDRGNPVFTRYFMKNGMPNDVVYGILEDSHGNLWLSTNFGMSRFDPDTETFKNFDTRDGLLGNEYNSGAYTRTTEGTFIFGGVNGASEFHPDSLADNPCLAPVVLTGFNIFDKPARLDKSISCTEEITLSYKDNYFSFEFASLDYSTPDRNRYAYMLEGLDGDWTQSGTRHFAGYTHVDAGRYVFRVKGTNGDGVWNEEDTSIRIIITPPFWETWWFITLLVLAIGGTIAFVITNRVRQLLAIERLRSKIAADLHDDIGAGLTEISIMGEVITQKLPHEARQMVLQETEKIGTTARGLVSSMSDIVWLVNPRRDSLYDLVSRLGDSFKETLNALNIQFRTENLESLKSIRLKMEYRQHLLLIFKEAINNSLKYSGCTEISLKVSLKGKKLDMRLVDDGTGFDVQDIQTGNGLKNMEDRASSIGGSLTIRSSANEGTEVEFSGMIS